jgi:hypothetical protein
MGVTPHLSRIVSYHGGVRQSDGYPPVSWATLVEEVPLGFMIRNLIGTLPVTQTRARHVSVVHLQDFRVEGALLICRWSDWSCFESNVMCCVANATTARSLFRDVSALCGLAIRIDRRSKLAGRVNAWS